MITSFRYYNKNKFSLLTGQYTNIIVHVIRILAILIMASEITFLRRCNENINIKIIEMNMKDHWEASIEDYATSTERSLSLPLQLQTALAPLLEVCNPPCSAAPIWDQIPDKMTWMSKIPNAKCMPNRHGIRYWHTTFWSEKYRKVTKEKRRFYFEGNYSVNWGQDNIKLANYRKNTATKTRTTKKWQRKRFKAGVLEVENKWVK